MSALPCRPEATLVRLRRDGLPPLRFLGRRLAFHDARHAAGRDQEGPGAPAWLWHDLALYSRLEGGYAVEIVARTRAGPARCHAAAAATLDAALTLLEGHDAAADLCPGLGAASARFDDPALPPILLALQASLLHCALRDVELRYRAGVGAFLMALGCAQMELSRARDPASGA